MNRQWEWILVLVNSEGGVCIGAAPSPGSYYWLTPNFMKISSAKGQSVTYTYFLLLYM